VAISFPVVGIFVAVFIAIAIAAIDITIAIRVVGFSRDGENIVTRLNIPRQ
jgi:hypothetical protein